jgi:hypothetical protein
MRDLINFIKVYHTHAKYNIGQNIIWCPLEIMNNTLNSRFCTNFKLRQYDTGVYLKNNNFCIYLLYNIIKLSWEEAYKYCCSYGFHPISLETKAEYNCVLDVFYGKI